MSTETSTINAFSMCIYFTCLYSACETWNGDVQKSNAADIGRSVTLERHISLETTSLPGDCHCVRGAYSNIGRPTS